MKKQILTTAIILSLGLGAFAQGGLFQKGEDPEYQTRDVMPMMPNQHGVQTDANGNGKPVSPLGSGIAMLLTLGGAYLVAKKRNEE